MNISAALRVCIAHIPVFTMLACSMPMQVKRINSVNEPAKGIRYIVKRPSYEVGIRLSDSIFTILDTDAKIVAAAQDCFSNVDRLELDVNIAQTLNGQELTYEITTPTGLARLAHIFSDTNLTVKTEADGTLQAVSAGETDKSLEFIQAVAALAISSTSAKNAKATRDKGFEGVDPKYCGVFSSPDFIVYAQQHLTYLIVMESLTARLTQLQRGLGIQPPSALAESSIVIEFLRNELEKTKESLNGVKHVLTTDDYSLTVDCKKVVSPSSTPWLVINLTK